MRKLLAEKVRLWMGRVPAVDTQAKLAVKAGMSASSIHRVLHEDTEPELETAYKLARAFGISLSEFLSDQEGKSASLLDADRYATLPDSEKAKIQAFAEFVLANHSSTNAISETAKEVRTHLGTTAERAQMTERVAQRDHTTEPLRIHAEPSQNRKKGRKLQSN